jgi:5'(3')-deoxyribonucleotidase
MLIEFNKRYDKKENKEDCGLLCDDKIMFIHEQYLLSEQDILDIMKYAREGNVIIEKVQGDKEFFRNLKVKTNSDEKVFQFGKFVSEMM